MLQNEMNVRSNTTQPSVHFCTNYHPDHQVTVTTADSTHIVLVEFYETNLAEGQV